MKKVFFKCVEWDGKAFLPGKEYGPDNNGRYTDEFGGHDWRAEELYKAGLGVFQRIEREVFHANGVEWFSHTPGDPMPIKKGDRVTCLWNNGTIESDGEEIDNFDNEYYWTAGCVEIIGWRYHEEPANKSKPTEFQVKNNLHSIVDEIKTEWFGENVAMIDRDTAAMDDGHLTPGQKRYIQAKEDEQASKEREASAREQLKKSEQAKALQEAAGAMDKVKPGFSSQMGWMA